MNLVRSLVLGGAAVFTVVAGAQAADLPSRKAAPVEYVRICDVYGAGFFYIPGTDTCLRVGGYVRVEEHYNPGHNIIQVGDTVSGGKVVLPAGSIAQLGSDQDSTGLETRGRVDLDARTQTSYGTVQTVVNLRGTTTDGVRAVAATSNFSAGYLPAAPSSASSITMERAYIRFAGFTGGIASENFSTMNTWMYTGNIFASFPSGMPQLAYTVVFGGGWSSTIAAETRNYYNYAATVASGPVGPSAVPTQASGNYVDNFYDGLDLIGTIKWDQPWGFVQLAGALGENSVGNSTVAGALTPTNNPLSGPVSYGAWAVGLTFKVAVPFLSSISEATGFGPGKDTFQFGTTYAHGMDGLTMNAAASDLSDSSVKRFLGGVVRLDSNLTPTSVTTAGQPTAYGSEDTFGIWGMLTHYWSPDWRSNWAGGYARLSPPTAYSNLGAAVDCGKVIAAGGTEQTDCAGLNTQWGTGQIWETNANLIWSPVNNFDIGLEVEYEHLASQIQNPSANFVAAGEPGLTQSGFIYTLRLERQF